MCASLFHYPPCSSWGTAPLTLGFLPVNAEAGGGYPVTSLEKSPPARAAWEVNSSRDSVLWSSDTLRPGEEKGDVITHIWSNWDAGPSSCTPGDCTDVPGAPLPLRPHEWLRSKDMRRISAWDLSTPDSPSFQLHSSPISFRWRSWDFNTQLICLTDRHSFLPHWNSSVKINYLVVRSHWGGCDTVKTRKINCFQTRRTNHSLKLPNITHQKQATSPELCETT